MLYHIHNTNSHFRVAKEKPNSNWTIGREIWHKKLNFGTLIVKVIKPQTSCCLCANGLVELFVGYHSFLYIYIGSFSYCLCLQTKTKAISHHTPSSYQSPHIINLTKVMTSMLMTISRCKTRCLDLVKFKHVKCM
jgi:hypothetical protein